MTRHAGGGAGVTLAASIGRLGLMGVVAWATIAETAMGVAMPRFNAPLPAPVQGAARALVTANLNGDRNPDIVVANGWGLGIVTPLLGNGDGTFTTGTTTTTLATGFRTEPLLVAADFNGDRHVDLAVSGGPAISLLLGDGRGRFRRGTRLNLGWVDGVVAGRLDGDDRVDLATWSPGGRGLVLLPGVGNGTFPKIVTIDSGFSTTAGALGSADLNNDGRADLVVVDGSPPGSVFLGNGDGTFQLKQRLVGPTGAQGRTLAIADLTNDGKLDIAVGWRPGGIGLLVGNGDGTFQPSRLIFALKYPMTPAVSDLNGDGLADLAVTNYFPGKVHVVLADGTGGFVGAEYPSGRWPRDVVTADFNRDGHRDIASANRYSQDVTVLLGGPPTPAIAALTARPARIRVGGRTTLRFFLPAPARVRVTVLRGRKVVSGLAASGVAGRNQVALAGSRTLPTGAYVVRVQAFNRFGRSRIASTPLIVG